MKERSSDQTAVSISLPKDLLEQIDARALALGLPRSQYLTLVARKDILRGGPFVIPSKDGNEPPKVIDSRTELVQFLIQALTAYEDHKNRNDLPEPPEPLGDSVLWENFLSELEEISQHKYYESQRAGYNVGAEWAIDDWLQKHFTRWFAGIQASEPAPTPALTPAPATEPAPDYAAPPPQ